MRNPLSKKIVDIQPSGIRKFFDVANEMKDAISLGVGEPDFDTPWRIREEGIFTLEKGRTFYTSNAGLKELRQEICRYLERKIHVSYDPIKETLITVGGSEAIDVGLRCMLDPGDEVLIPQPSYVSYLPCTIMADGVPVVVPLQPENEFKLTVADLEKYTTEKTKILIMPFPNNPTGSIMTKEDLRPVAEFVKEHDLYVLSDEIYSELTYKTQHVSIASLPGMRERTLVINGFSKGFAMTGWRLGYCCGPEVLIEQMTKLHQFAIMCAPTNSQYAAVEGLRNCEDEVEEMRKSYDQRRRFLMHEFARMGLECFEPFGAFYVFPSIREFGMSSEEFATRLLEEEKVAVVPGTAFRRVRGGISEDLLCIFSGRLKRSSRASGEFYPETQERTSVKGCGSAMLNIVLLEPEIPANTGNIGRTCVAAGARLHLIEPLGFSLSEKALKRAGMDYWKSLDVTTYIDYQDFLDRNPGAKIYMATTKARKVYTEASYEPDCYIMFGKESAGIPEEILVENKENCVRIPMIGDIRSLNLGNSAAIILYEALRQNGFKGMETQGDLHRLKW